MTAAEIYRIDQNGNEMLVAVLVTETNAVRKNVKVFKKVVK